jgi:deoxyribonuclease (pyrimidine dimer)
MTRINVVDPSILSDKALSGEWHEIPRVFTLAKDAYWDNRLEAVLKKAPKEYTLGTGHVLWFYDKLGFILARYKALAVECQKRGWSVNVLEDDVLLKWIPKQLMNNWEPTQEAIRVNMERLIERNGIK